MNKPQVDNVAVVANWYAQGEVGKVTVAWYSMLEGQAKEDVHLWGSALEELLAGELLVEEKEGSHAVYIV